MELPSNLISSAINQITNAASDGLTQAKKIRELALDDYFVACIVIDIANRRIEHQRHLSNILANPLELARLATDANFDTWMKGDQGGVFATLNVAELCRSALRTDDVDGIGEQYMARAQKLMARVREHKAAQDLPPVELARTKEPFELELRFVKDK